MSSKMQTADTFTVDDPVLIDLADWSVIRQGDNMPTPVANVAYDSTTNGECPSK
ncbi:MAG: hypothetical protein R3C18_17495 [Planctomycetaceae bacterium]